MERGRFCFDKRNAESKVKKSVTIRLYASQRKNMFDEGQFIRTRQHKRIGLVIKKVEHFPYETTLTCVRGYRPAPKSRLRGKKNPFSKMRLRIIR